METESLSIKTSIQISKPAAEVFEAIVDPEKMSHYFISESTGRMEENHLLTWKFPEFKTHFPVRVGKVFKDKYISFHWDLDAKKNLFVEIFLDEREDQSTVVSITEKEMENNEAGIEWLKSNTEGWANFLACLKAYLEFGINLRKGGFDYLSD